MDYLEVRFTLSANQDKDILLALLMDAGFESFRETDTELLGYIIPDQFDEESIRALAVGFFENLESKRYEDRNWNELWEKNFDPIKVDTFCAIRAPFHEPIPGMNYEVIIEPKMSFGTGHHPSTYLMVEIMSDLNFKGTSVLDFGCGTGVLAILAAKMGAKEVIAVDNNPWAEKNTKENIVVNNQPDIAVYLSDESYLSDNQYNIVLANVNRNVILDNISKLGSSTAPDGYLLVSGILQQDEEMILKAAAKQGLSPTKVHLREKWTGICFEHE